MSVAKLFLSLACLAAAQQPSQVAAQPSITDVLGQEAPPLSGNSLQPSQQVPQVGAVPQTAAPLPVAAAAPPAGMSPQVSQPSAAQNFGGRLQPAPNGANIFGGKSAGESTAGQAMASLLSGITQAGQGGTPMGEMATRPGGAHSVSAGALSQDSMAVVSGLVEAFMHKVKLEPGERTCLTQNMGALTGDIMGTVMDVVNAVKVLVDGKGSVKEGSTGNIVSAGIDSAMKITSLVTSATQLVKTCVHGDALLLMNRTASHLINGSYLEHRLLVNGVDIAHSLADSVISFEAHNFHQFGADIGITLRKILLSNATKATRLPEGMPEEKIVQKTMDGLMKGFFAQGAAMRITDTAQPDVDIRVDLHQCIAGNSEFFKELWMAMWDLIAKLSLLSSQHQLGQMFEQGQHQPKWAGELMIAMMQVPMALSRCGIGQEMQKMLMESIKTLQDVKVQFRFPEDNFRGSDASQRMVEAVEAWTNWDFEGFGYELGKLLRELVLLAFPQKYSVDESGQLRRYTEIQHQGAIMKPGSMASSLAIVAGSAVSLLVAFTVLRFRRSVPLRNEREELMSDIEDCSNDLAVE